MQLAKTKNKVCGEGVVLGDLQPSSRECNEDETGLAVKVPLRRPARA